MQDGIVSVVAATDDPSGEILCAIVVVDGTEVDLLRADQHAHRAGSR